LLILNTALLL
jgi:hypothetical protein